MGPIRRFLLEFLGKMEFASLINAHADGSGSGAAIPDTDPRGGSRWGEDAPKDAAEWMIGLRGLCAIARVLAGLDRTAAHARGEDRVRREPPALNEMTARPFGSSAAPRLGRGCYLPLTTGGGARGCSGSGRAGPRGRWAWGLGVPRTLYAAEYASVLKSWQNVQV